MGRAAVGGGAGAAGGGCGQGGLLSCRTAGTERFGAVVARSRSGILDHSHIHRAVVSHGSVRFVRSSWPDKASDIVATSSLSTATSTSKKADHDEKADKE
jgi:hypothetical protein